MPVSGKVFALVFAAVSLVAALWFLDVWLEKENHCTVKGVEMTEGDRHPAEPCVCEDFGDSSAWVCRGG